MMVKTTDQLDSASCHLEQSFDLALQKDVGLHAFVPVKWAMRTTLIPFRVQEPSKARLVATRISWIHPTGAIRRWNREYAPASHCVSPLALIPPILSRRLAPAYVSTQQHR